MTRKEPLPQLGRQWDQVPERLGGIQGGTQGVVGSGPGPGRGRDWTVLTLLAEQRAGLPCHQLPPSPSCRVSGLDYNSRGALRSTLLLSYHPIPIPPASKPSAGRAGGAERGGEGSRTGDSGDSGTLACPHQPAWDPTGHSGGTSTTLLESPTPTPPLFSRLLSHPLDFTLPTLSWVPDLCPLLTPGPTLLGAPLP